jgi:hypothetical protein
MAGSFTGKCIVMSRFFGGASHYRAPVVSLCNFNADRPGADRLGRHAAHPGQRQQQLPFTLSQLFSYYPNIKHFMFHNSLSATLFSQDRLHAGHKAD